LFRRLFFKQDHLKGVALISYIQLTFDQITMSFYCNPDEFWKCPFDSNHKVLAKRFPYHLERCQRANPHIRRVKCCFNATHVTMPEDLLKHMATCADGGQAVSVGLTDMGPIRPPAVERHRMAVVYNDSEIWGAEGDRSLLTDEENHLQTLAIVGDSNSQLGTSLSSSMSKLNLTQESARCGADSPATDDKHKKKTALVVKDDVRYLPPTSSISKDEIEHQINYVRQRQLVGGVGRGQIIKREPQSLPDSKSWKQEK